jgi:hypothetical protein
MKNTRIILLSLFVFCLATLGAAAQEPSNIVKTSLSQAEIDKIIKRFSENEFNFRQALSVYAFNRDARVQTIGLGGQVTGTFIRNSFMTFNQDGTRFERVIFAPISTTKDITVSPEDIENLGGVNPFAVEPKYLSNYNFTLLGKEKIDELDLYVFDVQPKTLPNPKKSNEKFFSGRIWVDDRDLMIVKSRGKALPEGKDMNGLEQRFPVVETWRDSVDNKFWFPVLSTADDELVFSSGDVVKIRMRVKYYNYRVGKSDVKILDDEVEIKDAPEPSPTPKKP